MAKTKKPVRRYKLTTKKGMTLKTYTPPKPNTRHNKLPAVVKIYTKEEIIELEKKLGLR